MQAPAKVVQSAADAFTNRLQRSFEPEPHLPPWVEHALVVSWTMAFLRSPEWCQHIGIPAQRVQIHLQTCAGGLGALYEDEFVFVGNNHVTDGRSGSADVKDRSEPAAQLIQPPSGNGTCRSPSMDWCSPAKLRAREEGTTGSGCGTYDCNSRRSGVHIPIRVRKDGGK